MADSGTDNFDRDFALSLLSRPKDAIYEIEEALKRIEKKYLRHLRIDQQANSPRRDWKPFRGPASRSRPQAQLERNGRPAPTPPWRARLSRFRGCCRSGSYDDEPEERPRRKNNLWHRNHHIECRKRAKRASHPPVHTTRNKKLKTKMLEMKK